MTDYNVNYTDINKSPLTVVEGDENNATDVSLFGRVKLEYGQELNEDLLHLLENFAAPEITGSTYLVANPDFSNGTYNRILSNPTRGQLWFNSTRKKYYFWNNTQWFPISNRGDYAANWGVIADGYQLPKPISDISGHVFDYSECIWNISPANFGGKFNFMKCATDDTANVDMKYRYVGDSVLTSGIANYLIIGIRNNTNHGANLTPPDVTPTPTPTLTPTITPSNTVALSLTPGVSPTASITPTPTHATGTTATPTPTITPTITPTHTHTPRVTPSQTPLSHLTVDFGTAIGGLNSEVVFNYSDGQTGPLSLHSSSGTGYTSSGGTVTCSGNYGAPTPSSSNGGDNLRISVTGGTAPYIVKFSNWSGSFSGANPLTGNYVVLYDSAHIYPAIIANSSGSIVSSDITLPPITSSGGTTSPLNVGSKCVTMTGEQVAASSSHGGFSGYGNVLVTVTDSSSTPLIVSQNIRWSVLWYLYII